MVRIFFLFGILFFHSLPGWSQDARVLLQEAIQAESAMQEEQAFLKYKGLLQLQPGNLQALCKSSELASKLGHRLKSKAEQLKLYEEAVQYAKRALKVNPASADANFVMAVALGRMALVSSGEEMITAVKDIKKFADKAVMLDPADFRGYHVLGKWYYEISSLGSFKRLAVRVFYGAFPEASFQLAARNYEASLRLNPAFNLNYLELAKVCLKTGQQQRAVELLEMLSRLPFKLADDARIRTEGQQLLRTLR